MKVCVLGAGGLGSVVGGCLADAGVEVTLVARPPHAAAVAAAGLRMEGIRGPRVIRDRLRAVPDPDAVDGDIDYLILLVKCRDTAAALDAAAALRPRIGCVLSLQNSVTKDDRLADWIGAERVVGASTTEAATLVRPGTVRHTGTAPISFYFGEIDGRRSSRVEELVAAFAAAGFGVRATDSIGHVEWEKVLQAALVATFSISTVGFLPDATMTDALQLRPAAEHYVALATELLAVYRALGFTPRDYFAPFSQFRQLTTDSVAAAVERAISLGRAMAADGVHGYPSMHQDLRRGRATEVEESVGALVGAADQLGIEIPTARAVYRMIRTQERLVTKEDRVSVPA